MEIEFFCEPWDTTVAWKSGKQTAKKFHGYYRYQGKINPVPWARKMSSLITLMGHLISNTISQVLVFLNFRLSHLVQILISKTHMSESKQRHELFWSCEKYEICAIYVIQAIYRSHSSLPRHTSVMPMIPSQMAMRVGRELCFASNRGSPVKMRVLHSWKKLNEEEEGRTC